MKKEKVVGKQKGMENKNTYLCTRKDISMESGV